MTDLKPKIICIIPAWNEEKNIRRTILSVKSFVSEIVVIDDGSRDDTAKIAAETGVTVVKHFINRGQGASLETGNEYARRQQADIALHFDGDGQFLASEIPDMLNPIITGEADIVFGSRFLGKKSDLPFTKEKIIMPLAHAINRILIGDSLNDPQNGFRALSRKALATIKIQNDEMAHCSEIIAKTFKYKLKYKEVPVTVIYNHYGQSFFKGFKIIKDLILSKFI